MNINGQTHRRTVTASKPSLTRLIKRKTVCSALRIFIVKLEMSTETFTQTTTESNY